MKEVHELLIAAVKAATGEAVEPELNVPDEQFGDYSTNVGLQLAKKLGQNPRETAEKIVAGLPKDSSIAEATVAEPGFINIRLSDEALLELAQRAPSQPLKDKVIVAEYSDPNPFKALHAGHLYTTLVGDSIASLLEYAGGKVHRLNYGGDVGLHVAKTVWAMVKYLGGEHPGKLNDIKPADRPEWVSARYVEGNTAYEEDEQAKNEIIAINKRVYQLHVDNDHDSDFARLYWITRQWSYDGFNALYQRLNIDAFEKYIPESEVTPLGLQLTREGLTKGVFEESEGAVIFKGEDQDLHTRVFINSAGLPTYEAKDLGLAAIKWRDYKFDLNVIITANDIQQYMQVVLKTLSSFYPEAAERTTHLTHGLVKLPGGVKMSSRKGNILLASDILNAAEEANANAGYDPNDDTMLAAVKYAFVKQRLGGDIVYDPEESVNLHGNSGPYLQYAHARGRSILAKAAKTATIPSALEPAERSLLRKISQYHLAVNAAVTELMPHHVANYLYELAQSFNRFYEHNRVSGDPREAERLWLVELYVATLKEGLGIFNIKAPEKM